ncbi:autophagy-related protein 4 [Babesia microti strain RI]|uniref:Cysteine protease n=1 Tax=Babesia microti (strain RI) TaxID=1133968 RepID=A0A1N6LWG3_BABMR|nr:autophagy-related protein 4 [Babesia microti strain RI]SIO73213.1 autophagy-related protein 4 [Babesia microti strain RI]|eukprot:XP_021337321.1 autophagy-related protein 4 [Babesia microti strain RI]
MLYIVRYAIKYVISLFARKHKVHASAKTLTLYSQEFENFWESLPYYTYNKHIPKSTVNSDEGWFSDAGWGCCVRSTQMAVARALIQLNGKVDGLFDDFMDAPLGIQRFYQIGTNWGPTSCARTIANLSNSEPSLNIPFLCFPDGIIVTEDIESAMSKHSRLVLLVSQRLGTDHFNTTHVGTLSSLFKCPEFSGLIGGDLWGRGYMFPAANETFLVGLDPHYIQNVKKDVRFQGKKPKILFWERLSPTITLVFAIKTDTLSNIMEFFRKISNLRYPPFELTQRKPQYCSTDADIITQF